MAKFRVHLTIGGLKHIARGEVIVDGVIETGEIIETGVEEPFRLLLSENLGEQIRSARVAKGLTLRELGQLSGLSASGIARVERGERNPGIHTVLKLEKTLREK